MDMSNNRPDYLQAYLLGYMTLKDYRLHEGFTPYPVTKDCMNLHNQILHDQIRLNMATTNAQLMDNFNRINQQLEKDLRTAINTPPYPDLIVEQTFSGDLCELYGEQILKCCSVCEQETEEPDYYNSIEEINSDLFGIDEINDNQEDSSNNNEENDAFPFKLSAVLFAVFSKIFSDELLKTLSSGKIVDSLFIGLFVTLCIFLSVIMAIFSVKNT